MTMLAQKPKQLFRSPFEHPLLAPGQFHGRIPHRNGHRLLLALCAQAGADHTPGPEVDPQTVTDRNDPAFEPIGALGDADPSNDIDFGPLTYGRFLSDTWQEALSWSY